MSPVEAAHRILDAAKRDPDLRRATELMIRRTGHEDLVAWCSDHPTEAVALAEQLSDIDGQIANMNFLLSKGDLS